MGRQLDNQRWLQHPHRLSPHSPKLLHYHTPAVCTLRSRALRWLLPAAPAVLISMAGCGTWVYDGEPPQPGITFSTEYSTEWMVRHPDCPWSVSQTDSALQRWPALAPTLPPGLRVAVYRPDDPPLLYNFPAQGGHIAVDPGAYRLLIYNNGLTTVGIDHSSSYADATASTGSQKAPDMLYRCASPTLETDCQPMPYSAQMHPAVWGYAVSLLVKEGLDSVAQARCALSGMSRGVRLSDGVNIAETADVPCPLQISTADSLMEGITRSFGTPAADTIPHTLTLYLKLKNTRTITYHYDCTAQVRSQPQGGIIQIPSVVINPSDANENVNTGGFDINVDPWANPIIIPVDGW